jgi:LCP family protein required for cell wall assembly
MRTPKYHWNQTENPVDPIADTQPSQALTRVHQPAYSRPEPARKQVYRRTGCGCFSFPILALLGLIVLYLFFPGRTNILILGIDDRQEGGALGRTDTMILTTVVMPRAYIGMLSIPRDLWVEVPGYGQNRVNTAHFFAEADQPGSGMQAAKQVVEANFGVDVDYAVRLRFDSFKSIVDALGGIEISLDEPMSGYDAGNHQLSSEQALAFVRDRQGSDDFFRMERGQIFLRGVLRSLMAPENLTDLPIVSLQLLRLAETDLPIYLWPRIGIAFLIGGLTEMDTRMITRDMVYPFTTDGGAQVLAPNWEVINPVLLDMFGQ